VRPHHQTTFPANTALFWTTSSCLIRLRHGHRACDGHNGDATETPGVGGAGAEGVRAAWMEPAAAGDRDRVGGIALQHRLRRATPPGIGDRRDQRPSVDGSPCHRIERLMRSNGLKARHRRRSLPKDDAQASMAMPWCPVEAGASSVVLNITKAILSGERRGDGQMELTG
jgi:hypothetical protein